MTGVVDRTNDNGLHLEGGPWLNYSKFVDGLPRVEEGDAVRVTVRDGKWVRKLKLLGGRIPGPPGAARGWPAELDDALGPDPAGGGGPDLEGFAGPGVAVTAVSSRPRPPHPPPPPFEATGRPAAHGRAVDPGPLVAALRAQGVASPTAEEHSRQDRERGRSCWRS